MKKKRFTETQIVSVLRQQEAGKESKTFAGEKAPRSARRPFITGRLSIVVNSRLVM